MTPPVDPARLAAYLGVTAVMVVTPGPAILFAIATGARRGRAAVIPATIGMNLASVVWLTAAGLGLSALAGTFPAVFRALAWLGAAYVAWLGLKAIGSAFQATGARPHAVEVKGRSALKDGFAVQIANPKALLFTTVILPPFIDPERPILGQILVFATAGIVLDVISMTAYGYGGAALAARMTEPRFARGFALFTGALLIVAAIMIAFRG
ncbi:MAG: LysE family translocator [Phenylobacterium sp.]|nr:LysE family translocator [Phenylobacterium sp.]